MSVNSQYNTSLTSIGDISGNLPINTGNNSDNPVYGASFKEVPRIPKYYEKLQSYTIVPPWLAKKQEKTFMNNIKRLNEDPVKTYKELEYVPIDNEIHDAYEQVIYGYGDNYIGQIPKPRPVTQLEGFSPMDYIPKFGYLINLFILFCVILIIYYVINMY